METDCRDFSLIILNILAIGTEKGRNLRLKSWLFSYSSYHIRCRTNEKKEKKEGGFFSNVSCEETFLNNSNPTAHVHCKILSIRTNQTHLHLPSFFQLREFRFSNILLSKYLERLFRRKKKEREKKKKKVTNSLLTFSSFSLQGSWNLKENFSTI